MKKLIVLSFYLIFFLKFGFAQNICGTIVSEKQIQLEQTFVDSVTEMINLEKTIFLSAHIVKNEFGDNGINEGIINGAIYNLNQLFEIVGLRFQLLKTEVVENYNYNTINYNEEDKQLASLSSVQNTINMYFVNNLHDTSGTSVCAYTFMPADNLDKMFFAKSCFNYTILAEQIGHFFNLYHTHETVFGEELADQSNCESTGDLCCDTYADPNLLGLVSDKCEYLGSEKDVQNGFYTPSVQNFMSFTEQSCKCFFSEEQYIRMINAVLKLKGHL